MLAWQTRVARYSTIKTDCCALDKSTATIVKDFTSECQGLKGERFDWLSDGSVGWEIELGRNTAGPKYSWADSLLTWGFAWCWCQNWWVAMGTRRIGHCHTTKWTMPNRGSAPSRFTKKIMVSQGYRGMGKRSSTIWTQRKWKLTESYQKLL